MTTQASAPPPSTKSQALRSYDVTDFPALTGLEEEWRFTPLKRLRGLTGEVPAATGAVRHEYGDLPEGVAITRVGRDDARVGSVLTPVDRVPQERRFVRTILVNRLQPPRSVSGWKSRDFLVD
ncbi:hypothetical protein ACWCO3_11195, partial [Micromonospora sp. NPDC002411]